ncbi:hypothetical protein XspCFBP7912_16115 [Xanthomonas sp. CFBP 7912]|nr:hypothetical protein XspCFBP7912_16115 [Xanthomonas sp. CFBP 7912]RJS02377.1 hypothetical protein XnspCFBP7698_18330 [Xanthomonas sp. CFBP 7698]
MRKQKAGATDLHAPAATGMAACGAGGLMLLTRLQGAARQSRLAVGAAHAVLQGRTATRHAWSFTAGRAALRWRAWPCVRH